MNTQSNSISANLKVSKVEFWRYVPTTEVVRIRRKSKNLFEIKFDHKIKGKISTNLISNLTDKWLSNHYGFCLVIIDNDQYKVSNYKKMVKELTFMGLPAIVLEEIKL